jgi:glycosyltransferase involved in cell wall biosynthesis
MVIVGDGPLRPKLEASVSKLGISSRVVFLGYLSDSEIEAVKAEIDIMVLPSETEGGAFSLIEAMSDGFPVVASDIAAHREVITAGEDGLLFGVSDSHDLARVLKIACTSLDLMETMGQSGRISSHSRFSVQRFRDRVGEISQKLTSYQ